MESLDYWRLCNELTVFQAALLIAGCDPSSAYCNVELWQHEEQPKGYLAAKNALIHAINSEELPAHIRRHVTKGFYDDKLTNELMNIKLMNYQIDFDLTTVRVDELKKWLSSRGFRTGFFFPNANEKSAAYLDITHPNYPPKLAAAVEAWTAVTSDDELQKAKSPKQALMKWLRFHATEYGLNKENGELNEQGIEEIAKVANWQLGGGVPKTPDSETCLPPKILEEDDIPF